MSFLMLKHITSTDIVERKERISLVVGYSVQSCLLFYRDKTFVHFDRQSKSVIRQGKLPFVASESLPSKVRGRLLVTGLDEQKHFHGASISVQKDYLIQTRQLSNTKPQCTTKHHLLEPTSKENQTFYIIRIQQNIENGISIQAFDFVRNQWQEQILHLNSKFLQYLFVDTSYNDQIYKEIGQVDSHSFALVAQGERFDSVNYSKMKVSQQKSGQKFTLKLKFIITRQIRLKHHFVIIGAFYPGQDTMVLAGNSKIQQNMATQAHHCPAYLFLNTHQVEIDEPQNIKIFRAFSHDRTEGQMLLRHFIGKVSGNMLFTIKMKDKKWAIAKINQYSCEILQQFQMKKPPSISISSLQDSLASFQSKLENFFERIKAEPTILEFDIFRIQPKQKQYLKLLKARFPKLSPDFSDLIIYLL